jgi:hypothetical protein
MSDEIPDDIRATAKALAAELYSDLMWMPVARALLSERTRAQSEERERIAAAVDNDFHWILPLVGNKEQDGGWYSAADVNGMTDDAACSVQEQIVKFIRKGGDGS